MDALEVDLLSEEGAKDYLRKLILALDELDDADMFGTKGWREYLGMEE